MASHIYILKNELPCKIHDFYMYTQHFMCVKGKCIFKSVTICDIECWKLDCYKASTTNIKWASSLL